MTAEEVRYHGDVFGPAPVRQRSGEGQGRGSAREEGGQRDAAFERYFEGRTGAPSGRRTVPYADDAYAHGARGAAPRTVESLTAQVREMKVRACGFETGRRGNLDRRSPVFRAQTARARTKSDRPRLPPPARCSRLSWRSERTNSKPRRYAAHFNARARSCPPPHPAPPRGHGGGSGPCDLLFFALVPSDPRSSVK